MLLCGDNVGTIYQEDHIDVRPWPTKAAAWARPSHQVGQDERVHDVLAHGGSDGDKELGSDGRPPDL